MSLVNRYLAWQIRRRHFAHLRYLQRNHVLPLVRGSLPSPQRQALRAGVQAVTPALVACAILLGSHAARAAEMTMTAAVQEPGGLAILLGFGTLIVYMRGRWSARRFGTLFQRKRKEEDGQ